MAFSKLTKSIVENKNIRMIYIRGGKWAGWVINGLGHK